MATLAVIAAPSPHPGEAFVTEDRIDPAEAMVRRGAELGRLLRALEGAPRSFDPVFKDGLEAVILGMEELGRHAEGAADRLEPKGLAALVHDLDRALGAWQEVNEAIEQVVSMAVRGRLDRRFFLLSPIANRASLGERLRLHRIRRLLVERAPAPAAAAAPARPIDRACPVPDKDFLVPEAEPPPPPPPEPGAVLAAEEAAEEKDFDECLSRLRGGDELDRSDAISDVIRRHQHLLLARLLRGARAPEESLARVLEALWRHVDVLLLEDYFFSARRMKLLHLLAVDAFAAKDAAEHDVLLRAMVLHPRPEYRRHAISLLSPRSFWSVASCPQAPLAVLADILERTSTPDVPDDYRRIFFDCTMRTVADARTEPQVRSARGMLSTFFTFDFFVEDDYFRKILKLNERVEKEEARLKIEDAFFKRSLEAFKKEKQRAGSRKTRLPRSFTEIPLTVQRKLARDGHYLGLFIRHPHPKIALETLRFITTPGAAEVVVRTKTANSRLVEELARKEDLLTSYAARLALLANPHAPLRAALRYVSGIRAEDLRKLAGSHDVNPEIAAYLRGRVAGKGQA
jgi:hypothetical protein